MTDYLELIINTNGSASYGANELFKSISSPITIGSSVTNINNLFANTPNLTGSISLTGGGRITNARNVFQNNTGVTSIDCSGLVFSSSDPVNLQFFAYGTRPTNFLMPHTAKPSSLSNFFYSSSQSAPGAISSVDFSGWDTSACTTFSHALTYRANLETINISGWTNPNSVTTSNMFMGCSKLTTLIIDSAEVFNLTAGNEFNGAPIASGTGYVYVPDSLVSSYQAANYWSTHANQIKGLSELPS